MPMMRDNLGSLTQRLPEVIDHGAQVGAGGQRLLERGQEGRPPVRGRPVPRRRQRADQPRFFLGMAREQALALLGQRAPVVSSRPPAFASARASWISNISAKSSGGAFGLS